MAHGISVEAAHVVCERGMIVFTQSLPGPLSSARREFVTEWFLVFSRQ